MSPVLGSRKRFLYRVLIYGAAPLAGLFVFLDNPDDLRGRVIGGLAIMAGATALVLLVTRLHDPWSAIRYALRPVHTLREVLSRWTRASADESGLVTSLHVHLGQQLPDVAITVGDSMDGAVLTLGEELTVIPVSTPQTSEDRHDLFERIDALRSPLEDRAIVIVLASDDRRSMGVDLSILDSTRGVHIVHVSSK